MFSFFKRKKKNEIQLTPRDYIYISTEKINSLYDQIEKSDLKKIEGELTINLGIASTTFKQGIIEENLYQKLAVVERYIKSNFDVGTVDEPKKYFKGELDMFWGPLSSSTEQPSSDNHMKYAQVIYFGGSTDRTFVGLGGSSYHLIGGPGKSNLCGVSQAPFLIDALCNAFEKNEKEKIELVYANDLELPRSLDHNESNEYALSYILNEAPYEGGAKQRVEFLAKKILFDELDGKQVLLGTPFYVAYL